jgi:hypothetical protein
MLIPQLTDAKTGIGSSRRDGRNSADIRPGFAVSFLLHVLVALLFVRQMETAQITQVRSVALNIIPVDLVFLAEETQSPPQRQIANLPQQMRFVLPQPNAAQTRTPEAASPAPPEGVAPLMKQTPQDALDAKLHELALLRRPDTDTSPLESPGQSNLSATSNGAKPGPLATYSVKDYVRAQVERRWNLDLKVLGGRDFVVAIHVQMKRDGTITEAAIVDTQRSSADALYRSIALSARNAVLLSSPVALPAGKYSDTMDMVLELNPRDTVR